VEVLQFLVADTHRTSITTFCSQGHLRWSRTSLPSRTRGESSSVEETSGSNKLGDGQNSLCGRLP